MSIDSVVRRYNEVKELIAMLNLEKDELAEELKEHFSHNYDGQKSYQEGIWKVTITTKNIYCVDKEKYQQFKDLIPDGDNFVRECVEYKVSRIPEKFQLLASEFISMKPAKMSVKVEAAA